MRKCMTSLPIILIIYNYLAILDLLNSSPLVPFYLFECIFNHIFLSERCREKETWQKTSEY